MIYDAESIAKYIHNNSLYGAHQLATSTLTLSVFCDSITYCTICAIVVAHDVRQLLHIM